VNGAAADAASAAAAAPALPGAAPDGGEAPAAAPEADQCGLGRSDSTSSSSGGEPEVRVMVVCGVHRSRLFCCRQGQQNTSSAREKLQCGPSAMSEMAVWGVGTAC